MSGSVASEQQYWRFNLYDIFSNFLPGAILLIGISLPIIGPTALFLEFTIGSAVVLVILAFGAGLAIQVVGSLVSSGTSHFSDHMARMVSGETDEENERDLTTVTKVDVRFWETCRSEFGFPADFSEWDKLYKLILAELEETNRSRTLRLQALFLASRGLMVTMSILTVYYFLYVIGVIKGLPIARTDNIILVLLFVLSIALIPVFFSRQKEFKQDVTEYMTNEYYLAKGTQYYDQTSMN